MLLPAHCISLCTRTFFKFLKFPSLPLSLFLLAGGPTPPLDPASRDRLLPANRRPLRRAGGETGRRREGRGRRWQRARRGRSRPASRERDGEGGVVLELKKVCVQSEKQCAGSSSPKSILTPVNDFLLKKKQLKKNRFSFLTKNSKIFT